MPKPEHQRFFVVMRRHGHGWRAARQLEEQPEWEAHARFMDDLEREKSVVLAGPLGEDDALIIMRAGSVEEITARLAADPWTANGLLRTTLIAPWTLRIGALS